MRNAECRTTRFRSRILHCALRTPHSASTRAILTTLGITDTSRRGIDYYRAVAALIADAAEALHHAHEQGVIHRDIKPSNLMLDSRGKLWITDFGLAHVESSGSLTMTGDLLGTLRYMSPEQVSGGRLGIDHRTDVYSLGATLYELLARKPVFAAGNRPELLRQIVADDPRPPRISDRSIPVELATISLKSIERQPANRYRSARELADELQRFLRGDPIKARPANFFNHCARWIRRHRALVLIVAASMLAALAISGGVQVKRRARVQATSNSVRISMSAAHTAIAAQDHVLAAQHLSEARGRLSAAQQSHGHSTSEWQFLEREIEDTSASIERFQTFLHLSDDAHSLFIQVTDDPLPVSQQALGVYGVLDSADWLSALEREPLGLQQITRVKQTAYETLLLMADYLVRWNHHAQKVRGRSPQEAGMAGLKYLAIAEDLRPATRSFYQIRSRCHGLLKDSLNEQADDKLAKAMPAMIALDYFITGRDYAWSGQREEGIAQLRAGLRVDPQHYWSLYMMGAYLRVSDRHDEAILAYTACTALRPSDFRPYYGRSMCHRAKGRMDEALSEIDRAIELRPQDPLHLSSVQHWQDERSLRFELPDLVLFRAGCNMQLNRFSQARGDFEKVLACSPGNVYARVFSAYCLVKEGQYRAAVDYAQDVVKVHARRFDGDDYYNMACVYSMAAVAARRDDDELQSPLLSAQCEDQAIEMLRRAVKGGFNDIACLREDADLHAIRHLPAFADLVTQLSN
jgi:tetratricopeptide (TPR) repeat protein